MAPANNVRTGSARGEPRAPAAPVAGAPAAVAIPALVQTHGSRLHALALRLCGNRSDADDVVQEVFLKAFRNWKGFRGDADPGTWLYTIALRSCHARRRTRGVVDRRMPAASQLMPWNETTVMQIAAAPEGTESRAETNEAIARVQAAITALPEHLRVPVVMKEVLEVSVRDVATALGLAENTVKTRLHRGRLALRKAMTARGAAVAAPPPVFEKQVCLDLLKAKMEAMDRGGRSAGFAVPQAEICSRCRAVFKELDLVQDACAKLGTGELPEPVRSAILREIQRRDAEERGTHRPTRRGRPPVKPSGSTSRPGSV